MAYIIVGLIILVYLLDAIGIVGLIILVISFILLVVIVFLIGNFVGLIFFAYKARNSNNLKINEQNLKALREMMLNQKPIIGTWLMLSAVIALSRDDTPISTRTLAETVAHSNNNKLCNIVIENLSQLNKQSCIDEVASVWVTTRHTDLASLLIENRWIASTPIDVRVLSGLKVNNLEPLIVGGIEVISLLLQACNDEDIIIAKRAQFCLEQIQIPEAKALYLFLT